MRNRSMHCGNLAVTLPLLAVPRIRAQVDWSDLFPGEGSKPAAPAPASTPDTKPHKAERTIVQESAQTALRHESRPEGKVRHDGGVLHRRQLDRDGTLSQAPPRFGLSPTTVQGKADPPRSAGPENRHRAGRVDRLQETTS